MIISKQGYNRNISKLMTLIFRNWTIFWDIPKWNRGQTKWDGGSNKIDNANTSQEFSNLPLVYVWNLIAWSYTSTSLFVREYKSLDSIEIKI